MLYNVYVQMIRKLNWGFCELFIPLFQNLEFFARSRFLFRFRALRDYRHDFPNQIVFYRQFNQKYLKQNGTQLSTKTINECYRKFRGNNFGKKKHNEKRRKD